MFTACAVCFNPWLFSGTLRGSVFPICVVGWCIELFRYFLAVSSTIETNGAFKDFKDDTLPRDAFLL